MVDLESITGDPPMFPKHPHEWGHHTALRMPHNDTIPENNTMEGLV